MVFCKRFLLLLICSIFFIFLKAQKNNFFHYTTSQGLPIDNVYAAAQNEKGIMWFATDFGISKFDGYKFTNYNRNNGIATKSITDIVYAGGDSCIFISYPNTIQSIKGNGIVKTLKKHNDFALQLITAYYNNFYFYQRGIGTFCLWQKNKLQTINLDNEIGIKGFKINAIQSLQNKGVAFCTNMGLIILQNNNYTYYKKGQNIYSALLTTNNTITLITNTSVEDLDENYLSIATPINLPKTSPIYHSIITNNNTIWMRGLDKGLFTYKNKIIIDESAKVDLSNKVINKIFIDKEENIWLCTDGQGVVMKPKNNWKWFNSENGLISNKVTQLFANNKKLFIGTENGVNVKENDKLETITLPKYNIGLQYVTKLFVATNYDVGLNAGNVSSVQNIHSFAPFQEINFNKHKILYAKSTVAYEQNTTTTWIANGGIIEKYDNKILQTSFNISKYKVRKIYDLIVVANNLYIGTTDGILILQNNKIIHTDTLNGKLIGEVFQFKIFNKNQLWAASENGIMQLQNNKWEYKVSTSNFRKNYCQSLTADDKGLIWVATWDGIFSTDGITRTDYSTNNGLCSKTCNAILYNNITNEIIVGTDNGLNIINKNELLGDSTYFEMQIFATINDSLKLDKNDNLNADVQKVSFYVNLPYYNDNSVIQYKYKLDDDNWIVIFNPNIEIGNIAAGKHTLYVCALKNGKEISKKLNEFKFTKKQYYYKTWWFLLLAAIALQILFLKIFSYFSKKLRRQKIIKQQQQMELAALKQQAFTALMNPHFIFNALNSVQNYINKQDRLSANKYLSEFASLIRKSFDSSKNVFSYLDDEIEMIKLYLHLEKMRFGSKFNFTINSTIDDEQDFQVPTLLLQPVLENAILHGIAGIQGEGIIAVNIMAKNNVLYISISDNGIGIEQSKKLKNKSSHQSRGMQLIKDRIDILSKFGNEPIVFSLNELYSNAINKGTLVQLIVPQNTVNAYLNYVKSTK